MVSIHFEGEVACSAELLLDEEVRISRCGQRLVNILNLYHRREQAVGLRKKLAILIGFSILIDELREAQVQLCSPRACNRVEHVLEKRVWDTIYQDPLHTVLDVLCCSEAPRRYLQATKMQMSMVKYEIDLVLLKDIYRGLNLLHFGIIIWHRLVAHERILDALAISTSIWGCTAVDGRA